jgi:hypothetical protein
LANSRKLLSAGLARQNSEAVIRGHKGATLYASPGGAALEGWRGRLSWTLRLVTLVPELMVEGLLVAV